jgi:hypothetical protein
MPKHLFANHPNQPAMPFHDLGKCTVIAVLHKPHQQLAIARNDRVAAFALSRPKYASIQIRQPKWGYLEKVRQSMLRSIAAARSARRHVSDE